jgi:hypothetical protein
MKISPKLMLAASVITITGSLGAAGSASAATDHCDGVNDPGKVELSGEDTTVDTGFAPGSWVCIKVGTQTDLVQVAADGSITSTIVNKNGVIQGISYYVCEDTYGCEGSPS